MLGKINNRKAEISNVVIIIILILITGLIVTVLVGGGVKNILKSISMMSEQYKAPKISNETKYLFSANDISATECILGATTDAKHTEYSCTIGKDAKFSIDITNYGSKDRRFNPMAVICKYPTKDCCNSESRIVVENSEYCAVTKGAIQICFTGSYSFTENEGFNAASKDKYEIHPMVECQKDPTFGCYDPGMTDSVKICNNDNYVIVSLASS